VLFSLEVALERTSRHKTIRSIKQSLLVFLMASERLPVLRGLISVAALCSVLVTEYFELVVESHCNRNRE